MFFIRNGLPSKPVGLSRIEQPEVNSYYELEGKRLLLSLAYYLKQHPRKDELKLHTNKFPLKAKA